MVNRKMEVPYVCSYCGKRHAGLPMDFAFNAPYYWTDELAEKDPENNFLNPDVCVIGGRDFFVRGVIEIPVVDKDETFNWGVWVSLSKENFKRYLLVYGTPDELKEKPYFGWLSNEIPIYPKTLNIKTHVHLQGNTLRPKIELDHSNDHPLCQEQHTGISMARVHEIIDAMERVS